MKPKYWRRRRKVAPQDEHEVVVMLKPGERRQRKGPFRGLAALLGHKPTRRVHRPSDEAHQAVDAFAVAHGLVAVPDGRRRLTVRLRGTVEELSSAFEVSLSEFEFHGRTHIAHDGDAHIAVPDELTAHVHAVLPDRRPHVHHRIRGAVLAKSLPDRIASESDVEGRILPLFTSDELRDLYGFPLGGTGAGQTIGIIALGGGFYPEDMDEYFASIGRPTPKIVVVGDNNAADKDVTRDVMRWMNVRGAELETHPTDALASAIMTVETSMDIQAAAAFAPEATIVVYTTPSTSLQDLLDVLNTIHDDEQNSPSVVSCSFSLGEHSLPPYTELGIDYILQELAEAGVTVCVASGDFGAQGVSQFAEATEPQVMWPAASEWAVACGGTRIVSALPKPRQIVFREVLGAPVGQMASGGGFSTKVDRPEWQTQAIEGWSQIASTDAPKGRGLPDVALNAHLETSFPIRVAGYDGTAGGTSAAAPVMGAWIACLNQTLNTRLGHVTPLLYRPELAKAYEPVVRGENDVSSAVAGFHADEGWDPCTGLGAPSARLSNALRDLHRQATDSA